MSTTAPLPHDILGSFPATSFTLLTFRVLCSATVSTVSSMVLSSVSKTIFDGISLLGWNPSAETQELIHGHADGKERVGMRAGCCSRAPHRNRTDGETYRRSNSLQRRNRWTQAFTASPYHPEQMRKEQLVVLLFQHFFYFIT